MPSKTTAKPSPDIHSTTPPGKPPPAAKVTAALSVLAETYEHRALHALTALREREAVISTGVRALVDEIETALTTTEGEDTAELRALVGEDRIATYTRAARASRSIALIVESETPESTASDPATPAPVTSVAARATPVGVEAGTISLAAGANGWNFQSLRKSALEAATSAGWSTERVSRFRATLATTRRHPDVLAAVREAGLRVVD